MLVPLSRRTELYHALSRGGKNLERVFRHWRDRYSVGGNDVDSRPKRTGIGWQNLRAQAALLIEWFRIVLRHGWLGSHRRRNTAAPTELTPGRRLQKVLDARERWGLDLPYGPAAERIGYSAPARARRSTRARRTSGPSSDDDRSARRREPLGAFVVAGRVGVPLACRAVA